MHILRSGIGSWFLEDFAVLTGSLASFGLDSFFSRIQKPCCKLTVTVEVTNNG